MTRTTLLVVLALCLIAVATSLAILAAVVENPAGFVPGGFVHTEPRPQPALVDPNPGEPAPAPEPAPAREPVPASEPVPAPAPEPVPPESAVPPPESVS